MPVIDGTLNISNLQRPRVKAWLYFLKSILAKVGVELTTKMEEDKDGTISVYYTLEGSRAAFAHRLDQVIQAIQAFAGAMAELDQSLSDAYIQGVAVPIIVSCSDATKCVDTTIDILRECELEIIDSAAFLPRILSQATTHESLPDYWSNVIESCQIVIRLLHTRPSDPTLAVIIMDRACEIVLKSRIEINNVKFPTLISRAIRELGLPKIIADNVYAMHRERNNAQHEGREIEFQDAVRHAQNGFQALEWLYEDGDRKGICSSTVRNNS